MNKILVIGLPIIDYIGKSFKSLIDADSNPGNISVNYGGVGRNSVETLARLHSNVTFIGAFGNDIYGHNMKEYLEELGVTIYSPKTNKNSASYMAIHNELGEMTSAICDTDIANDLSIEYLKSLDSIISSFEYILIDTNTDQEVIDYIINTYKHKKIIVNGISTTKVQKVKHLLKDIYLLGINNLEADSLNIDHNKINTQNIIITNGPKPIYYRYNGMEGNYTVKKIDHIVNETGAGDALLSAITYGLINNYPIEKCLDIATKVANKTLLSIYPNAKDLDDCL